MVISGDVFDMVVIPVSCLTHPLTWALIGLLCALGIGVAQVNIIYFPITFQWSAC